MGIQLRNCCGISLETGTKIIGCLGIVCSGILFRISQLPFLIPFTIWLIFQAINERFLAGDMILMHLLFIFAPVMLFVSSVLLVTGAHKKRASYLILFMVSSCLAEVCGWMYLLVIRSHVSNPVVYFYIIGNFIHVYFLLVIHSYYNELKEKTGPSSKNGYVIGDGVPPPDTKYAYAGTVIHASQPVCNAPNKDSYAGTSPLASQPGYPSPITNTYAGTVSLDLPPPYSG